MNDFKAKAEGLFKRNPNIIRYFFTQDTQAFEHQPHAEFHASKLKDHIITMVYRPEMSAADITAFEKAEAAKHKVDLEKSYRKNFPELARLVDANARRHNPQSL